jgi:hypothetical protein
MESVCTINREFIHLPELFTYNKLLLIFTLLVKDFGFHVVPKMDIVTLFSQFLIHL